MNLNVLIIDLQAIREKHGDALVMVQNMGDGTFFSVETVEAEIHEDADGSTTVWVKVDEY